MQGLLSIYTSSLINNNNLSYSTDTASLDEESTMIDGNDVIFDSINYYSKINKNYIKDNFNFYN